MLYTEVLSGLWIGDIDMIYNKKFLEDNQIQVIINCTVNHPFSDSINHTHNSRLPLSDNIYNCIDTLRQNKHKILEFINSQLEFNHILICCQDGTCISPFIVSLYLIHYGNIQKSEVRKIIQSKNQAVSMDYDLNLLDL